MQIFGMYLAFGACLVMFLALLADRNFIKKLVKDEYGLGHNFAIVLAAISFVIVSAIWPILVVHRILIELKIVKKRE